MLNQNCKSLNYFFGSRIKRTRCTCTY